MTLNDKYFVDEGEYLEFLAAFDFGLVLYVPDGGMYTGKNIKNIGLASGKFAAYCMLDLPIIFCSCSEYDKLNTEYEFGYSVSDKDGFWKLLSFSLPNLRSGSPLKLYNNKLDPLDSITKLIDKLVL